MNQILVKIYVPSLEKTYEVWIPPQKRIYNVIVLLAKAINELNDNCFRAKEMPMLYDKYTGETIDVAKLIIETEIRNGTELILI